MKSLFPECANPSCQHRRAEHWHGRDCRAFEGCKCQLYISDIPDGVVKLMDRELELSWIEVHRELTSGDLRFSNLGTQLAVMYSGNSGLYRSTACGIPKEFRYVNPAFQKAVEVCQAILSVKDSQDGSDVRSEM